MILVVKRPSINEQFTLNANFGISFALDSKEKTQNKTRSFHHQELCLFSTSNETGEAVEQLKILNCVGRQSAAFMPALNKKTFKKTRSSILFMHEWGGKKEKIRNRGNWWWTSTRWKTLVIYALLNGE